MSISLNDIPKPVILDTESIVPREVLNLRTQFDVNNLNNSANVLHDYIDELSNFVHCQLPYESFDEFIQNSKQIVIFKSINSNVWENYNVKPTDWTACDELIVSVYTLNLIYILKTVELLEKTLNMDHIVLENWKRCNNYLKVSYGYLMSFKNHIPVDHRRYFNLTLSLSEFYIQLIIILKNLWDVQTEISDNLGRFDNVPKNVTAFIKILVFMNNELKLIDSKANSAWKSALNIILCYYLGLKFWDDNKIGLANGFIQCALTMSLEQGEIRGKLNDNLKKLHIVKTKERNNVRNKELFMNEIKLERSFRNIPLLEQSLKVVVKLLRILYIKFGKINETLAFEDVLPVEEIKQNYLFTSKDLPNGSKVPLTNYTVYKPITIKNHEENSKENYF